jgi:hypothetical protein
MCDERLLEAVSVRFNWTTQLSSCHKLCNVFSVRNLANAQKRKHCDREHVESLQFARGANLSTSIKTAAEANPRLQRRFEQRFGARRS